MTHARMVWCSALASLCLASSVAFGRTWTVGHSGQEDFDKVLDACAAASAWDSILVSPGEYGDPQLSVILDHKPLTILGTGLTPDDTRLRMWIVQSYCGGAVLQNLSIRDGGGLNISEGSIRISTCTIRNHVGNGIDSPIYLYGRDCVLEDCIFSGNGHSPELQTDGALYFSQNATIRRCVFVDNAATESAGAFTTHGDCTIEDCVFVGNTAPTGAAIRMWGNATIRRCTFWANHPTAPGGGAILIEGIEPSLSECIIGGTIGGWGIACPGAGGLACCDMWDNDAGDYWGDWFDAGQWLGNFLEDPMLCDPDRGDFGLQTGSPCLAGDHYGVACGRVGARDVGCGVIPTRSTTWGTVRMLWR